MKNCRDDLTNGPPKLYYKRVYYTKYFIENQMGMNANVYNALGCLLSKLTSSKTSGPSGILILHLKKDVW